MDDHSLARGGLPDVHSAYPGELSALDEEALTGALVWLLRPCGGAAGRTWNNDAFQPGH
jgi:hypothetical protein